MAIEFSDLSSVQNSLIISPSQNTARPSPNTRKPAEAAPPPDDSARRSIERESNVSASVFNALSEPADAPSRSTRLNVNRQPENTSKELIKQSLERSSFSRNNPNVLSIFERLA